MPARFFAALALVVAAGPAVAADPPKKADPVEGLLGKLFDEEVQLEGNLDNLNLQGLMTKLSARHNFNFVINYRVIEAEEALQPDAVNEKPVRLGAAQLRGLKLGAFLDLALPSMGYTYLVRAAGYIEIVPPGYAAKVAKAATTEGADGLPELAFPLVSAVLKDKPLNEAVALFSERYDLNVVVAPQAGDARTGFVTARLLNVPADRALDLLAVQCDLRVVRKGNAFLITSRDHATEMANERMEKERQKIELERLRTGPPPVPPVAPAPQPEPKPEAGK